jgi:hypothetical protein
MNAESTISPANSLIQHLRSDSGIAKRLEDGFIQIIEVEKDWGPITRFIGTMSLSSRNEDGLTDYSTSTHTKHARPRDFWLIADDDVYYSSNTISKYHHELHHRLSALFPISLAGISSDMSQSVINNIACSTCDGGRIVLSQFITDYRVAIPIHDNNIFPMNQMVTTTVFDGKPLLEDQRESLTILKHIQAVDTYLFPAPDPQHQELNNPIPYHSKNNFTLETIVSAITYFHKACPESFYQDDYLVAYIFHVLGFDVISIWKNDKLAQHIDHVSKSNFQMHMNKEVFIKEDMTKSCIFTFSNEVIRLIREISST